MKAIVFSLGLLVPCFGIAQNTTRFSKLYDYNNNYQSTFTILEVQSGGYIIGAKNTGPEYSDNKLLLYRLDAYGSQLWQKEIYTEGFIYYFDYGSMLRLPDGNYLLGGTIKEISTQLADAFLIKMDTSGNLLWTKTYGIADKNDSFSNFALTPDSARVMICGQTRRTDASGNIWLLKTNLDGDMVWETEYQVQGWQHGQHLAMLGDGSFLLAVHFGNSSIYQYKVYKISASGQIIWERKLGTEYDDDGSPKIVALPDGSGLFTGAVGTTSSSKNIAYVAKLSPVGEIVWEKKHAAGITSSAFAQPVLLENGKAILSGGVTLDLINQIKYVRLWKIDAEGEILWERIYSYNESNPNYIYHQIGTSDGGIAGVGFSHATGTLQDIWMLKVDSLGCLEPGCDGSVAAPEPGAAIGLSIRPNPVTDWLTVASPEAVLLGLRLTDLSGRVLEDVQFFRQHGLREYHLSLAALPPGLYVLSVRTEKGWVGEQVVKN
jgi:hypothetical protein